MKPFDDKNMKGSKAKKAVSKIETEPKLSDELEKGVTFVSECILPPQITEVLGYDIWDLGPFTGY